MPKSKMGEEVFQFNTSAANISLREESVSSLKEKMRQKEHDFNKLNQNFEYAKKEFDGVSEENEALLKSIITY